MYSILQELSTHGSSAAAGAGNKTAFVFYMGNRLKFTVVLVAGYFLLQQLKGALPHSVSELSIVVRLTPRRYEGKMLSKPQRLISSGILRPLSIIALYAP